MMRNLLIMSFFCLLLLVTAGCPAAMTIRGKVAVAGHEPFTYTRVIDEQAVEYKLVGSKEESLRKNYQNQVLTLKGSVVKEAIGPGFPAEFEVLEIIIE